MKKILSIILLAAAMLSCSTDHELYESVIIYDENEPDLPIYSEWGYNAFGAYYDDDVFISNTSQTPLDISANSSNTTFTFIGDRKYSMYSEGSMKLRIIFSGLSPLNIEGLSVLNAKTYDLTSSSIQVQINLNGSFVDAEVLSGEINFKRFQKMFVDKEFKECILSGRFNMRLSFDGETHEISDGRFDFGISERNFSVR